MNKIFKSIKENKIGILLMIISSVLVCFGQYFWKISKENWVFLIPGFALYGIGAIVMIIAYKFGKLSVLQPVLALNYIFALLIGIFLLNEQVKIYDYIGITLIFVGVFLIAGGDSSNDSR